MDTHTHTHTCTIWKLCLFLLVFRRCDNNVPTHPGIEHRRFHLFCLCVLLLSKCRSESQLSSVFWNQLTWILEIVLCSPFERNGIEWNQGEESWLYIWGKLFEFLKLFGCFSILHKPKEISENPHIFSSLYLGRQFMFLIWKDKSLVKMVSKILSTFVSAPMLLTSDRSAQLSHRSSLYCTQWVASDGIPSISFIFLFPLVLWR